MDRGAAWVSGGAAGIGLACCRALAAAGWRVACADLQPGQADLNQTVDVSDAQAVQEAVAEAERELGPLTAAVNNAGIMVRAGLLATDAADARRLIEVNLLGVFYGLQAQARRMAGHGRGEIINVSSGHAAIELAPLGVRVNAVAPGYTFTEMSRRSLVGERLARVQDRLPLGRVAEADEAAEAVVLLAGGALPQMIGQTLRIDGGWTISDPPLADKQGPNREALGPKLEKSSIFACGSPEADE